MLVRECLRKAPITVPPECTLEEGARLMGHHGVGSLLVVSGGELLGIVTDRDIVVRAVGTGQSLDAHRISCCVGLGRNVFLRRAKQRICVQGASVQPYVFRTGLADGRKCWARRKLALHRAARNSLDHLFALAAREQVPESRRDSLPARQALRCGQDLTQVKAHKIGYSETSTRQ